MSSYRVLYPLGLLYIFSQSSKLLKDPQSWILMMIGFLFLSFFWIWIKYRHTYKKFRKYASFLASNNLYGIINFGVIICMQGYTFVYRQQGIHEGLFAKLFMGMILTSIAFLFVSIFILPRILDRSIADTEALIQLYGE